MKTYPIRFFFIKTLCLIIILNFTLNLPLIAKTTVSATDSLALVALYNATDGTNWKNNENWLTGPVNNWWGITVDGSDVIEIRLGNDSLNGIIPEEIGQISNLKVLDFSRNQLKETIPDQIWQLSNLESLTLAYNHNLKGNIPPEIKNLNNLSVLNLWDNQFDGTIPAEIGELTNLTLLCLGFNNFTGTIPAEICNLKNLTELWLFYNQLSGTIPKEIGQLTKLTLLSLGYNQLSGNIPPEIGQLTSLVNLDLGSNLLNGNIPKEIGQLRNLNSIMLGSNLLTGTIPDEIWQLTQLIAFGLKNNHLYGNISSEIINLVNLKNFNISNNLFEEVPDLPDIESDLHCSNNLLTFEDFERNLDLIGKEGLAITYNPQQSFGHDYDTTATQDTPFTLSIPCGGVYNHYKWYKEGARITTAPDASQLTFPSIQLSDAGTYHITVTNDSVPDLVLNSLPITLNVEKIPCIERDSLVLVALYNATDGQNWTRNNKWLTGPVSTWWGITTDSCNVTRIVLSTGEPGIKIGNNLAGTIPVEIGNLSELTELNLSANNLTGNIPREIGNLNKLQILDLKNNQLSGNIPIEIYNLSDLNELELCKNQLSGIIPSEIGNLNKLRIIDLSENQLSGNIPVEIGQLINLTFLHLQANQFGGSITREIGQLINLSTLWLGDNQLSGNIPTEIGNLSELVDVDLIDNNLTGIIPPDIGNLNKLQYLVISNNQLSGIIPPEIGKLSNLTTLSLNRNQLSGIIPAEIGDLTGLKTLSLDSNKFSGNLPPEIGNLSNLQVLTLEFNNLSGNIPSELGNLSELSELIICENKFVGEIPEGLNNLAQLRRLEIQNNLLNEIPDLSNVDSIFYCSENYLTFEDFERNLNVIRNASIDFQYSPQYEFGREYDTIATEKSPFTLNILCGGIYNHYKWHKDGSIIQNAPDAFALSFSEIRLSDAGTYNITVINDSVPDLELTSLPVTLTVENYIPGELIPVNLVIVDGSRNPNFIIKGIEDYQDNNLVVFSKWGKIVFEKTAYLNDLDFSEYPKGTYYYILTYKQGEQEKQIRNFVDVFKK